LEVAEGLGQPFSEFSTCFVTTVVRCTVDAEVDNKEVVSLSPFNFSTHILVILPTACLCIFILLLFHNIFDNLVASWATLIKLADYWWSTKQARLTSGLKY